MPEPSQSAQSPGQYSISFGPNWPKCKHSQGDGCPGIQVNGLDRCLAHLDPPELDDFLARLRPGADIDARGTRISSRLLTLIQRALREGEDVPRFGNASFDHAQFEDGAADFSGVQFDGDARFERAVFEGEADFGGATFVLRGTPTRKATTFKDMADFRGVEFRNTAKFGEARFVGKASFYGAKFSIDDGQAFFRRATFEGPAGFRSATFASLADLSVATFNNRADFSWVTFSLADFSSTAFTGHADFSWATLGGTDFSAATFGGADFSAATFNHDADFRRVIFTGVARFGEATTVPITGTPERRATTFKGEAKFEGAQFNGQARFEHVTFEKNAHFGSVTLGDGSQLARCRAQHLDLSGVQASRGLLVQCRVDTVEAVDVQCPNGLNLQLSGAINIDAAKVHTPDTMTFSFRDGNLVLVNAAFDAPAVVAAPGATREDDTAGAAEQGAEIRTDTPVKAGTPSQAKTHEMRDTPRLLGLDRVDATNLTLAGLDLRACRFLATYHRDQLRIDGVPQFAPQPEPARLRWTHRKVLAEEHAWRARYDRRPTGWFPEGCRYPGEPVPENTSGERTGSAARQEASRIQAVYRDLRKGREDAKDEPGAADLYYGEMEMRRLAAPMGSAERALLTAYWILSGYGLRATRALAALILVLAAGTAGFATVGFAHYTQVAYRAAPVQTGRAAVYQQVSLQGPHPGWITALVHALESALSLFRETSGVPLTPIGRALEITLRLLGPLLLGLAVLAVRGRVKR